MYTSQTYYYTVIPADYCITEDTDQKLDQELLARYSVNTVMGPMSTGEMRRHLITQQMQQSKHMGDPMLVEEHPASCLIFLSYKP